MSKKKVILLLSVLVLLALAACCLFYLRNDGLTEKGRKFKVELGLADFHGSADYYTWTCPSNVTVSNQTFKIADVTFNGNVWRFALKMKDGVEVAMGVVYIASSAEAAVDGLCNHLAHYKGDDMKVEYSVGHDEHGNVLLQRCFRWPPMGVLVQEQSTYHQTYDNLFIETMSHVGKSSLSAKDFALPLLEAGAKRRFPIFGL